MKKFLALIVMLMMCLTAQATVFTDLKFGRYQIADSQWNVSACMYSNTCEIYSKNPGTAYKIPWTSGQISWAAGDYIKFVKTDDSTNPYNAIQYNSNGTQKAVMGTGHIINMGSDYFFFVGNDNNTGQLFSMTSGFSDSSGVTWTGILNPTVEQVDTYAAGGSTSPLGQGESVGGGSPTVVSTTTTNDVSTSSSTSYSTTDSVNATTTDLNGGTLSTYNNSYTGTTETTTITTTTTPVTTTTYSDGSTTTSNGTSSSSVSITTVYTLNPSLANAPSYSAAAPNTDGNSIYIKQSVAGSATTVNITQDGNYNAVTGVNNGWAYVDGNGSSITINQYGQGNIAGLKMLANNNTITVNQGTSSADANNNVLMLDSLGNSNSFSVNQSTNNNNISLKVINDSNTLNVTQQTGTGNRSYVTVTGNLNTVNNTQTGSNNLSLINISGDNNLATVSQIGNNHSSLLNLINAGGANTVNVTQTGNGDAYSLQQTCTNPAGCSTSVIRNK